MDIELMKKTWKFQEKRYLFLVSALPGIKNRQFEYFFLDQFPNRVYHKEN